MPEDETIGFLDLCDVFDLVWLEKDFAVKVKEKTGKASVDKGRLVGPP